MQRLSFVRFLLRCYDRGLILDEQDLARRLEARCKQDIDTLHSRELQYLQVQRRCA